MKFEELKQNISELSNPDDAKNMSKYFKTGKGEYGENDIFIGIRMPMLRRLAKKAIDIQSKDILIMLRSKVHEERMLALLILMYLFQKTDADLQGKIYKTYIDNREYINNWDLVDVCTPNVIGAYLLDKDRSILYDLAKSNSLWDKRIAIISTFHFIRHNQFEDTLKISDILLADKHDLIHKAVGWMLREIGKRDLNIEKDFLKTRYNIMPRTMLRYAIERFEETERQKYLKGIV